MLVHFVDGSSLSPSMPIHSMDSSPLLWDQWGIIQDNSILTKILFHRGNIDIWSICLHTVLAGDMPINSHSMHPSAFYSALLVGKPSSIDSTQSGSAITVFTGTREWEATSSGVHSTPKVLLRGRVNVICPCQVIAWPGPQVNSTGAQEHLMFFRGSLHRRPKLRP